jgi:ATP-binding cassette subfamily A (ABC1) protein 3
LTAITCMLVVGHGDVQGTATFDPQGLVLMIAQFVMAQIDSTKAVNESLMTFYRLSPGFCLGHGLWQLCIQDLTSGYLGSGHVSPLSANVAGTDAFRLFWLGPAYLLAAILVDYARSYPVVAVRISKHTQAKLAAVQDAPFDEDEDVAAEVQRVSLAGTTPLSNTLIQVSKLRKVYGPISRAKVAVVGVSFGVQPGECFGSLGVNGAGKTTTMKCLTGDVLPTAGQAYVGTNDILTKQRAVRRCVNNRVPTVCAHGVSTACVL